MPGARLFVASTELRTAEAIAFIVPSESRLGRALLRAVARANHWRELLESGTARSAYDLARREGCRVSYVQRHLPFAFLAPDTR